MSVFRRDLCTTEQITRLVEGKHETYTLASVSFLCVNDPGVYQACGFNTKITGDSYYLCGGYFKNDTYLRVQTFVDFGNDSGDNTNISLPRYDSSSNIEDGCNDKCDSLFCENEAVCGGHVYGIYCDTDDYSGGYVPIE